MTLQAHLSELKKRHEAIDSAITDAQAHPASDGLMVAELKKRKLRLKEEISRLGSNDNAGRFGQARAS